MNYWIFKCNPDMYNLAARLNDPNPDIMALPEFIDSVGTGLVMKGLVVHPWREAAPGTANLAESCFRHCAYCQ